MAKKGYIGAPITYTELEYIESSGTQYIDTGFKANQDTRMDIVAEYVGSQNPTAALGGARNGSSENFWIFWGGSDDSRFLARYNNGSNIALTIPANFLGRHTFSLSKNVFSVDGKEGVGSTGTFTSSNNIFLFALNAGSAGVKYHSTARIYSCQIYDNGTLIRDYIPCKYSDGRIGLYDKVNDVFYPNAGTGTFTAGGEISTVTTQDAAREVKKIYVGIDGVARKVKKGYIGVGGVARPFL